VPEVAVEDEHASGPARDDDLSRVMCEGLRERPREGRRDLVRARNDARRAVFEREIVEHPDRAHDHERLAGGARLPIRVKTLLAVAGQGIAPVHVPHPEARSIEDDTACFEDRRMIRERLVEERNVLRAVLLLGAFERTAKPFDVRRIDRIAHHHVAMLGDRRRDFVSVRW